MNAKEKIKSLSTIFDDIEQLEIGPHLTEDGYKRLTHKITYMLALAYDKGFKDGWNDRVKDGGRLPASPEGK